MRNDNKVSKKEYIENNNNTCARMRESYADILEAWEIPKEARPKFFEFIKHRQCMKVPVTNDYLDGLCEELDLKRGCNGDEMIKILQDAINGGYADIKRVGG